VKARLPELSIRMRYMGITWLRLSHKTLFSLVVNITTPDPSLILVPGSPLSEALCTAYTDEKLGLY